MTNTEIKAMKKADLQKLTIELNDKLNTLYEMEQRRLKQVEEAQRQLKEQAKESEELKAKQARAQAEADRHEHYDGADEDAIDATKETYISAKVFNSLVTNMTARKFKLSLLPRLLTNDSAYKLTSYLIENAPFSDRHANAIRDYAKEHNLDFKEAADQLRPKFEAVTAAFLKDNYNVTVYESKTKAKK